MNLPFASFPIERQIQLWLNELSQYKPILYFDWDTFIDLLEKEPLALTAVTIAFLNIVFTVSFKLWDSWKESKKESSKRAVLHIEAHRVKASKESPAIEIILTNIGKEVAVIRDIGYQPRPLFLRLLHYLTPFHISTYKPFERHQISANFPVVIPPHEFFEFQLQGDLLKQFKKSHHRLSIRDSLGRVWLYRGTPISKLIQH